MDFFFIDESGINFPLVANKPTHLWTFVCLKGEESFFFKICSDILSKLRKINSKKYSGEPELSYRAMLENEKEISLNVLDCYNLDFEVLFCDYAAYKNLFHCEPDSLTSPRVDEVKKLMIQMLILKRVKGLVHEETIAYSDSGSVSKKGIKKIRALIKESGKKVVFKPLGSRRKKGLQISDILAGAARAYRIGNKHYVFFESRKDKIVSIDTAYFLMKFEYKDTTASSFFETFKF